MTTHELARFLLDMPDLPVVSMDGLENYCDLADVHEIDLYENRAPSEFTSQYYEPSTKPQRDRSFKAVYIG
jgi:hypothetical protein